MFAGVHVGPDTGEFVQEPAQHLLPVRRMHHLGVILHTRQPTFPVLERRNGSSSAGGHHVESIGSGCDRVAVAHPHRLRRRQIRMQLSPRHIQLRAAVLAGSGLGDRAAEHLRHGLKPVADAEHRHPEVEYRRIQLRRAVGVHAGRPAGQHDGLRVTGLDVLHAGGVRDNLGIHPGLTDAAGDELRVLRAEVDHQHWPGRC